jgi:tetrahydromethanopterin S-methyltransferase subunit F
MEKRDPVKFARNAALVSGIFAAGTIGMGIASNVSNNQFICGADPLSRLRN